MRHVGLNETRSNGVAADVAASQFVGNGFGEANDAGLAGGIARLPGVTPDPDDRTHIDDGSSAGLHHGADDLLGEVEYALQVDVHHFVPLFRCHTQEQVVLGDTGVVHTYIDGSEFLENVCDKQF